MLCFFRNAHADTSTINNILRHASEINSENNPDSSLRISNVAAKLAMAEGDMKSLAAAYYYMGKAYILKKEYTLALQRILSSDSLYKLLEDTEGLAMTNLQLGLLEYSQHNYTDALPYFKTAKDAARLIGNTKITGTADYLSGLSYLEMNELQKAESLLVSAIENK